MKHVKVISSFLIFLVLWELASKQSPELMFFVSSPSSSFNYATSHFQNILNSTLVTLTEAFVGFILAAIFSFIIMLLCLIFPRLLRLILPVFVTSQVLPIITLAPLFIILFGMGIMSKIAMVILMCFFPIFINFSAGVSSVSQNIHDLLQVYNANKFYSIFRVIIPLSTPQIFTGLKVSTTMAIMGAIVAEFVGAKDGLGKNLYLAPKNSLPELMVCSIIMTTFLGWILFKLVELLEKKLGKWYL